MGLFKAIRAFKMARICRMRDTAVWYDINERPDDMGIKDIIEIYTRYNLIIFDSMKRKQMEENDKPGFKA